MSGSRHLKSGTRFLNRILQNLICGCSQTLQESLQHTFLNKVYHTSKQSVLLPGDVSLPNVIYGFSERALCHRNSPRITGTDVPDASTPRVSIHKVLLPPTSVYFFRQGHQRPGKPALYSPRKICWGFQEDSCLEDSR